MIIKLRNYPSKLTVFIRVIVLIQLCVPDTQWGQTNQNIRVGSRESFVARLCEDMRWLMSWKAFSSPEDFGKVVLKGRLGWGDGHRVWDQLAHNSLIGWWWGSRVEFLGSRGLRLCAHGHQVDPPSGWGGAGASHLKKQLRKFASNTII